MALTRCQRRAIAKAKAAAKREKVAKAAYYAWQAELKEKQRLAALQKKERNYYPPSQWSRFDGTGIHVRPDAGRMAYKKGNYNPLVHGAKPRYQRDAYAAYGERGLAELNAKENMMK